jgi:hypothetical protein
MILATIRGAAFQLDLHGSQSEFLRPNTLLDISWIIASALWGYEHCQPLSWTLDCFADGVWCKFPGHPSE